MAKFLKNCVYLLSIFFFLKVFSDIEFEYLLLSFTEHIGITLISILLIFFSQLTLGIVWSRFLNKKYNFNFIHSLKIFVISVPAKYIPGKVTSPILRVDSIKFKNIKSELLFFIFTENIIVLIQNILFGLYFFFDSLNIFEYLLILNFVFFIIFNFHKIKYKKFSFEYLKNIFLIEFSTFFNILGIYLILTLFEIENPFQISLLYIFTIGLSMVIFLVPAGVGVRENIFIEYGQQQNMNLAMTSSISILLRSVFVIADLMFLFLNFYFKVFTKANKS